MKLSGNKRSSPGGGSKEWQRGAARACRWMNGRQECHLQPGDWVSSSTKRLALRLGPALRSGQHLFGGFVNPPADGGCRQQGGRARSTQGRAAVGSRPARQTDGGGQQRRTSSKAAEHTSLTKATLAQSSDQRTHRREHGRARAAASRARARPRPPLALCGAAQAAAAEGGRCGRARLS